MYMQSWWLVVSADLIYADENGILHEPLMVLYLGLCDLEINGNILEYWSVMMGKG